MCTDSIFVSIACFMDNDIENTVDDCLKKAKYPNNITFGICLQMDENDKTMEKYQTNHKFKIHKMNWSEARGPAYARAIIYDMFQDEDYFFQIDCHSRFFKDWDVNIINCLNECKKINKKAIISHYPVNILNRDKTLDTIVNITTVRCIDSKQGIKTHGRNIKLSECPKRSWGISAAMLFFDRDAYKDVVFDKNIYFGLQFEEQVVLAARYWTHGYDIFTPSKHIISTEYLTNRERQKKSVPRIPNLHKKTFDRLCHIMKLKYNTEYNNSEDSKLGVIRSIEDYYKMLQIFDKVIDVFPQNYLESHELKKKLIVGSVGFGFEFGEYLIKYILQMAYPKCEIEYKNSEDCDLIIYTHFTRNQDYWNKTNKPFILWNGEKYPLPINIKGCSNRLLISSVDENAHLNIPYAFFAYVEYKKRNLWLKYKNIDISNKRLFGYCISAVRVENIRNEFIEKISKKSQDIWSFGRYTTELSKKDKIEGKWNNECLQEKYSQYKFIFAAENTSVKGYITEKIINAFSAGAIPIYLGDSSYAKKIFNEKAFICVDDFQNMDDCIDYIISLDNDKILNYMNEPIFSNNPESEIFKEYNNYNALCNKEFRTKINILMNNDEICIYDNKLDKSLLQSVIINLEKETQKYENMSNKLNLFNIPYSRFNAILGTDIYDNFKSSGQIQNNGYTLRPHQVGVWQSHYKIWQYMIFNNIERLFIFEDDCSFVNDFKDMYHKTLEMVQDKEYDILFLGYSGANVIINKDLYLLDHGVPRCLHSYVLTLSGAKKLVEKMSIIDYPIDEIIGRMFFRKELKGYRTSYILVYQPWQYREDKYPLPSKYINKYDDLI